MHEGGHGLIEKFGPSYQQFKALHFAPSTLYQLLSHISQLDFRVSHDVTTNLIG